MCLRSLSNEWNKNLLRISNLSHGYVCVCGSLSTPLDVFELRTREGHFLNVGDVSAGIYFLLFFVEFLNFVRET